MLYSMTNLGAHGAPYRITALLEERMLDSIGHRTALKFLNHSRAFCVFRGKQFFKQLL
jgi:hypothetical protein